MEVMYSEAVTPLLHWFGGSSLLSAIIIRRSSYLMTLDEDAHTSCVNHTRVPIYALVVSGDARRCVVITKGFIAEVTSLSPGAILPTLFCAKTQPCGLTRITTGQQQRKHPRQDLLELVKPYYRHCKLIRYLCFIYDKIKQMYAWRGGVPGVCAHRRIRDKPRKEISGCE